MRTLYLDCNMGVAGDMLTAALLELVDNQEEFVNRLNKLGLPNVVYKAERVEKCGIKSTHMSVLVQGKEEDEHTSAMQDFHHEHHHKDIDNHHGHIGEVHFEEHNHSEEHDTHEHHEHDNLHNHEHHHEHHSLNDIAHIVSHLDISDDVKKDIMAVYGLITEAESNVHGKSVQEIHFHEVGTLDAIADVTAVCMLMHELSPDKVISSPINVGSGHVRCAHGILPVPAPATALLLTGIPTYSGLVESELCTPTGASLIKYFANEYGVQPRMRVNKIGYGSGKKEFEVANCVRALLGDSNDSFDTIVELSCNLDDMSAEAIGFAMDRLLSSGALDVYTTPIGMKKNRLGTMLTCMCKREVRDEMIRLIFLHTTTLGIREYTCNRYVLNREVETLDTEYGTVRIKRSTGFGVKREKLEHDDLARIALEKNISILDVEKLVCRR